MNKSLFDIVDGSTSAQQQAASWFSRLRADDASEHDRQAWRAWMDASHEHQQAYTSLETMWSMFGEYAHAPELSTHLQQALAKPIAAPRRWPLRLALAATLAAAALIGSFWLRTLATPPEAIYSTAIGERRLVQLEDGTRADLDTNSRLHVQYNRRERKLVLEQGRAFFRVAHEARPLRVEAGAGSVRAVGTQFEVIRHDNAIDVALYEGKVDLMSSADRLEDAKRLSSLVAGQSARISGQRVAFSNPVQAGGAPAWLSGRLTFNDRPLGEVIKEFNRYSKHPITLANPALAQRRVSGSFRSDDPVGFVEALEVAYAIDTKNKADGSIELDDQQ